MRRECTVEVFCLDLMPQGEARRTLARKHRDASIQPTDWAILRAGAGSPVGNLRRRMAIAGTSATLAAVEG